MELACLRKKLICRRIIICYMIHMYKTELIPLSPGRNCLEIENLQQIISPRMHAIAAEPVQEHIFLNSDQVQNVQWRSAVVSTHTENSASNRP